jgi:hypothetical protein
MRETLVGDNIMTVIQIPFTVRNSDIMKAIQDIEDWLQNKTSHFKRRLLDLFAVSDLMNQLRLAKGYPEIFIAIQMWHAFPDKTDLFKVRNQFREQGKSDDEFRLFVLNKRKEMNRADGSISLLNVVQHKPSQN